MGIDYPVFQNSSRFVFVEFLLGVANDTIRRNYFDNEVRRTVIHELAHHAGIAEDRLAELRYD